MLICLNQKEMKKRKFTTTYERPDEKELQRKKNKKTGHCLTQ